MEQASDPEKSYIDVIMKERNKLCLKHVEKISFWLNIKLIFETFDVL